MWGLTIYNLYIFLTKTKKVIESLENWIVKWNSKRTIYVKFELLLWNSYCYNLQNVSFLCNLGLDSNAPCMYPLAVWSLINVVGLLAMGTLINIYNEEQNQILYYFLITNNNVYSVQIKNLIKNLLNLNCH